ncbi:hypothetical protein CNR22_01830 [Sphingobacteriaceae bacterium]|nr:hypothetical protein CNR22_01830 [Sphingobacteriaceae bacterium]
MSMDCNLVLSGGGTRGYSQIGVIQGLMEQDISISAISGTSCGALIGAFICDGFHPSEIEELLIKEEPEIGLNYSRFWHNLLSFDNYSRVLKANLRSTTFEALKKPLYVNLTDLNTGKQKIVSEGNMLEVLIATAAIPVLLPPCFINGVPYADGGLSNNLPVEPFINSSKKIIGVHVNPIPEFDPHTGIVHGIDRSLHLLMRNSVLKNMDFCDVFIEPPALKTHHLFESKKTKELITIGYDYVTKNIDLSNLKSVK